MTNTEFGTRLDIPTSVEFIENALIAGKTGFVVNTEVGSIGVEYNNMFEDTVIVTPWIDAPDTRWAKSRRRQFHDFYIAVRPAKTYQMTHNRVVKAISMAIFISAFKNTDIPEEAIDASIKAFMYRYDGGIPSINATCEDWSLEYMNPLTRLESTVKNLTREYIVRRDDLADAVLIRGEKILRNNPLIISRIGCDSYCRQIVGIMLYIQDKMSTTLLTNPSVARIENIEFFRL